MDFDTVDAPALMAFVEAKGLARPCELCGRDDWTIDGDRPGGEGGAVVPGLVALALRSGERFMGVYSMHCTNCGNTKLLSGNVVAAWVAASAA